MSAENGVPADVCPNCGLSGKHFAPPSFGQEGFYTCGFCQFEREHRYLVVKKSDYRAALTEVEILIMNMLAKKVATYRSGQGKDDLNCVCVEKDWPEYELVWKLIEFRMAGTPIPDPLNRIAELEAENEVLSDSETALAKKCVDQQNRIADLEEWKKQATEVFALIDFQSVAKELNVELGDPISTAILPGIRKLKSGNYHLRERISVFLNEAAPWLDVSGAMYNRDLADCADRRLRKILGEG